MSNITTISISILVSIGTLAAGVFCLVKSDPLLREDNEDPRDVLTHEPPPLSHCTSAAPDGDVRVPAGSVNES
ncbi:hypothetical protein [Cupriavidus alkaliphilus]|uniref:hypothetical protein n=1 Tax=Cupriavidus alkaliphilus TaxID=942866 RepID=UPI00161D3A7F|nr:hypothetical protein [Cupriavidus alkaliphilus]MBB2918192.1 hypothetical protein [Cupriavidus alkaliphilus]